MKVLCLAFLASCGAGAHLGFTTNNSGGGGGGGGGGGASSPGGGGGGSAVYDKYAILDEKLGMPLEKQAGFTCGPPRGTDGYTTQNHSCVKFTDARCTHKATKIHHIRSSADVDANACFMDEMNGATYLDRDILLPPLFAVRIVGTDTKNPKVFQIIYTFAADDLTESSKLGKALIAKYGPPTSKAEPVRMVWESGEVQLRAECRIIAGDHAAIGDFCTLSVEDQSLDRHERDNEAAAAAGARETGGPPPPAL